MLLADFDRDVAAIAAQPFLLQAHVGGTARRHVPDFLLVHADKSARASLASVPTDSSSASSPGSIPAAWLRAIPSARLNVAEAQNSLPTDPRARSPFG